MKHVDVIMISFQYPPNDDDVLIRVYELVRTARVWCNLETTRPSYVCLLTSFRHSCLVSFLLRRNPFLKQTKPVLKALNRKYFDNQGKNLESLQSDQTIFLKVSNYFRGKIFFLKSEWHFCTKF